MVHRLLCVVCVIFLFFTGNVNATDNWIRSEDLKKKSFDFPGDKAFVFPKVKLASHLDQGCNNGDLELWFDISRIRGFFSGNVDVNKFYLDGVADGSYALRKLLDDWEDHGYGQAIPVLEVSEDDWSELDTVKICVGTKVALQTAVIPLYNIFLWYDDDGGPVIVNIPSIGNVDISSSEGSLVASDNGKNIYDVVGFGSDTPPTDTPTPGLPDFIVTKLELSDYNPKKTDSIKMKGQSKNIGDDDVGSDDKIESRFYLSRGLI